MCGIAGLLRRDGHPVDRPLLERMTDVLSHRGPDGRGFYVDGAVGLGHRRLAIIDLTNGAQPMGSDDGMTWIAYNGEVYNYGELRDTLRALGHSFHTTSDTEVVLRAYEVWGGDCLQRLRGMFALAIWDGRRRQLLLARDRVGIKPLVYAWDGTSLRFGSEIKALLEDPVVPRDLDWEALRDYLVHNYIPAPRTIFTAIRKLPPASYLLCSLDGGEPEVGTYWQLRWAPNVTRSEADWIEELRHLLDETVRLHLASDVPLGAFLSGGVDSSSVVASMARVSSAPIRTFAIGFDESDFDELSYARLVAQRYGTDHFEQVVKPDVISILPRLAWQFDEPFADASAVPTYCVANITRQHVTVALSGDGGDENFAGYARYARALRLDVRLDTFPLPLLRPVFAAMAAAAPESLPGRRSLDLLASDRVRRYYRMMTYHRDQGLRALLSAEALQHVLPRTTPEVFERLAAHSGSNEHVSMLQHIDMQHYLPDDILAKVDRTTMLTSLEARVPLLDHVLMEHVATIPRPLKLGDAAGKLILKHAMADRLPAAILSRRKMGFGVPLAAWLRKDLKDFAHDVLLEPRARQRGLLNPRDVARLLHAHTAGARDYSAQLWAFICLELWCRTWWSR